MINPKLCRLSMRRTVLIPCQVCMRIVDTGATETEATLYFEVGRKAQEAFAGLPPELREMFISGTCPSCWDKMFPEEEASALDGAD